MEELGHSRPDLRNPALAVMADTLTDAENRYSGIPTIRREMAAFLGIKMASYAIRQYVLPLVETGKLKMTILDRPGSPRQTYYKA